MRDVLKLMERLVDVLHSQDRTTQDFLGGDFSASCLALFSMIQANGWKREMQLDGVSWRVSVPGKAGSVLVCVESEGDYRCLASSGGRSIEQIYKSYEVARVKGFLSSFL